MQTWTYQTLHQHLVDTDDIRALSLPFYAKWATPDTIAVVWKGVHCMSNDLEDVVDDETLVFKGDYHYDGINHYLDTFVLFEFKEDAEAFMLFYGYD